MQRVPKRMACTEYEVKDFRSGVEGRMQKSWPGNGEATAHYLLSRCRNGFFEKRNPLLRATLKMSECSKQLRLLSRICERTPVESATSSARYPHFQMPSPWRRGGSYDFRADRSILHKFFHEM